jgi:hypothetical protein
MSKFKKKALHKRKGLIKIPAEINKTGAGHQWLTPVILATWEVEIRKIAI